jgi:DNA repair ATPase RecN
MASHPHLEEGNGDIIPEGLSVQEYARIMARCAASLEYSIGSLTREVSDTKSATKTALEDMGERLDHFEDETRQSFEQLGVVRKRLRKVERQAGQIGKKAGEIGRKAEEIAEELEDTKSRDLRSYKRKYNWWKNGAISTIGAVVIGVIVILIGHYVFHVG